MADEDTNYKITEQTDIEILEGELTGAEKRWLDSSRVLDVKSHKTNTKEVTRATLDVDRLAQLAFEYEILKEIASSVETDIMDVFRRTSDSMLTTSQLADATGRPKSSISRALSRLVEKGKLHRVQAGVYKHA